MVLASQCVKPTQDRGAHFSSVQKVLEDVTECLELAQTFNGACFGLLASPVKTAFAVQQI